MARLELYGTARCPYTAGDARVAGVEAVGLRGVRRRGRPRGPRAHARRGTRAAHRAACWWRTARWSRSAGRARLHRGCGVIMASACSIRVRGVVQGVGFRPFVYRLARANTLGRLGAERRRRRRDSPRRRRAGPGRVRARTESAAAARRRASRRSTSSAVAPLGLHGFTIRESQRREQPTVRISPDLPVCDDCLEELFDPAQSALRLSLHQLHELRPALHRRPRPALRPRRTPR